MAGSITIDEGAAPSTPATGDTILYAKTDGKLYSKDDAGAEYLLSFLGGTSGGFSFRNRMINPRGAIYQRTVAASADDTYIADRWYVLTQTNTVTPSVLTDPEDGFPFGVRITQTQAVAQRFGFAQIIEGKNCKDLRGQSGVLVPRIRVSNGQAIRYAILGWTGTEDTVTSDVVLDWTSSSYTAGGFFLGSNLSVIAVGSQTPSANTWTSLTALTAALGSSFNNIIIMVWTEGTAAQNFTLDFDYVQFEQGSTFTAFETRSFGQELALCQRYLVRKSSATRAAVATGLSFTTTSAAFTVQLPSSMRTSPTLTSSNLGVTNGGGAFIGGTSSSISNFCGDSLLTVIGVAAGLTAGQSSLLYAGDAAGGFFQLDAEL